MSRLFMFLLMVFTFTGFNFAQEQNTRRTSGVKTKAQVEAIKNAELEAQRQKEEQARLEIEKERQITEKAKAEALAEAQKKDEEKTALIKAQMEKLSLEKLQAEQLAEAEKAKALQAEEEKKLALERSNLDAEKLKNELQSKTDEAEQIKAAKARIELEKFELEKQKVEAERLKIEAEQKNQEILKQKVEQERLMAENQAIARQQLIEATAKRLNFNNPPDALALIPENVSSVEEIENILSKVVEKKETLVKTLSFCDADFRGEPLNLELTADDNFGTLLQELRMLFGVNFLPDSEVVELPIRVNVQNVPWNYVLRTQLNYLDLEARCTEGNTIAILKRSKWQTIQESQKKSAPLVTEFIKLKYLHPTVGGQVDVTGRSSSGGSSIDSLENAINKILKADGDNRGSISRIPGKNEFIITATAEQLLQIKTVIAKADKPSYQVVIYASVVTANENKLRDVGGQFGVVAGTGNLNQLGGLTGFPGGSSSGSGTSSGSSSGSSNESGTGGLNPGGVRTLGSGFGSAPSGGSVFGISSIFGTVQLQAQLSLLETKGAVKVDNRPSIIVIDGQTADLQIGRNVFVPIQSIGSLGGGNGSLQVINAANSLNASPQVIEDGDGNPVAVNLNLRVESNDVDTSVVSQGVPSVIRRATQTSLMLNTSQTAIIGGFSTDSETMSDSQTPGLGKIPVLGNLFKRKVRSNNQDRLYFAIRVEIIKQGEILNVAPVNISTEQRLPNPNNDFFKPYNQPITNKPNN